MAYDVGFLPRWILMYIGQKTNVRLRDLQEQKLEKMVKKTEKSDLEQDLGEIAVDMVYDEQYFSDVEGKNEVRSKISYLFDDEKLVLEYKGQRMSLSYDELMKNEVEKLEANYMIEPNVG